MTGLLHSSDSPAIFPTPRAQSGQDDYLDPARQSPREWMRARREARERRRDAARHQRAAQSLNSLGPSWEVVDLQRFAGTGPMTFLAIGPGGVFAVTVKDHGRTKVAFAGDVVQIDGRRPKYVTEARENARLASTALSRVAGISVPVMPVLAFAGSGVITFYGMPKGCIVSAYQELGRVLNSRGNRLAQRTVKKLFALADHPATWSNAAFDRYDWSKGE
ncbi:hypothetical protein Val02_83560 [Virgisporangium aliadipatigenens]|uniref:NERD domain-containing protein n=1 Tax=Virgisporangium aliadipatigenens TaxID=741659 RepID=A0A8J3YXC7_9ACTN|nr:hypothetical protein [Virgisporangium aliadipatigenens]GIJ51470.1 hypothetical protein Val02_83560 [Virgisporangium aliadipatigenens]